MGKSREIDLLREAMEEDVQHNTTEHSVVLQPEPTVEQNHPPIQQRRSTVEYKRRAKPWLQGVSRRTLKNIVRTYSAEEIYRLITARTWPYRTWAPFYHIRDKAFMGLLYLAAGRICEVLSLKRAQFDFEADSDFIVIRNMLTEKIGPRSPNFPFREEFPLPRSGRLQPFTLLVTTYLDKMEEYHIEDERLFPFSRGRGWQIVEYITGKWPHWFRAQGERLYGKKLKDIIALKDLLNVVNIRTLAQYIKKEWTESREKLL